MSNSIQQEPEEVKSWESQLVELVTRASALIAALAGDEDEDSPVGRAIVDWLRDAEATVGPDDCECILPGQHCRACEVTLAAYDPDPALDGGWWGYPVGEACQ